MVLPCNHARSQKAEYLLDKVDQSELDGKNGGDAVYTLLLEHNLVILEFQLHKLQRFSHQDVNLSHLQRYYEYRTNHCCLDRHDNKACPLVVLQLVLAVSPETGLLQLSRFIAQN